MAPRSRQMCIVSQLIGAHKHTHTVMATKLAIRKFAKKGQTADMWVGFHLVWCRNWGELIEWCLLCLRTPTTQRRRFGFRTTFIMPLAIAVGVFDVSQRVLFCLGPSPCPLSARLLFGALYTARKRGKLRFCFMFFKPFYHNITNYFHVCVL